MEAINKQKVDLGNGIYNALWSGFIIRIMIPHKGNIHIETKIGVKGINCKTIVEIKDGDLTIIS